MNWLVLCIKILIFFELSTNLVILADDSTFLLLFMFMANGDALLGFCSPNEKLRPKAGISGSLLAEGLKEIKLPWI